MKKKHIEFLLKFHKKSRHLYTLRDGGVVSFAELKFKLWAKKI